MEEENIEKQTSILEKPEILRREAVLEHPQKKGKWWIFKLVLILIVIGIVYYLFTHPEIIREPVDNFFGRWSA